MRRHNIAQNNSPLRILITGGRGGTGKSFLLQLLTDYVGITHAISAHHHQVIVGAPRGIAARNVKACTIHSIFRLPVQHGYEAQLHAISAQNLKILREKFRYVTTIILDEISMISMKTFEYIHERLCNIADNNHPFGNYNIICFGDFYQLRPVRGHYLFKHQVLWDLFQPFFLFANQRQAGDNDFIAMLNNIRLGMLTVADVDMLQTRFTSRHPNVNLTAPVHIYPTLKEVHAHNSYMQNTLDSVTYEHAAIHTFGMYDPRSGQKVPPELLPCDDRQAGGLLRSLELSIGTRVVLLRNFLTQQGLLNGAMGIVTHLTVVDSILTTVYVKFDDHTTGVTLQNPQYDNSVPIDLYRQEFVFRGHSIIREQFPLQPCWACTVHKTQGLSLDSAVISLGDTLFQAGQAYVALSRVRTINGLYITAINPSKIYANETVCEEYRRLMNLP